MGFPGIRVKLQIITPSELGQTQKDKRLILSLLCKMNKKIGVKVEGRLLLDKEGNEGRGEEGKRGRVHSSNYAVSRRKVALWSPMFYKN